MAADVIPAPPSPSAAGPTPASGAAARRRGRPWALGAGRDGAAAKPWRVAIGTALAGLVLLAVLLTAALIHVPWSWTARQNVTDVAERLNGEIVASVRQELTGILGNTAALAEALRSILVQGAISPEDEAKREYIFLSLLRSQPAVSWLAFGWPNGNFFGAEKVGDDRIRMVEVRWDEAGQSAELRTDDYWADVGEVFFQERHFAPSSFNAAEQPWYQEADRSDEPVWTTIQEFPNGRAPSISISTQLVLYGRKVGVISIAIDLTRLSRFLANLDIGTTGTVAVLDPKGVIVASADPEERRLARTTMMRRLQDVTPEQNRLFVAINDALATNRVDLGRIAQTQLYRLEGRGDEAYFVNLARLGFKGWVVATVIPEQDFLANIDRNTRILFWVLVAFTAGVAGFALLLSHRLIVRPLKDVAGQLRHLEAFEPERVLQVPSSLRELDDLSTALTQMGQGLVSFRKYLPAELVRTLVAQGIAARPDLHQRTLSVMFTDLAGFTGISERLGEEVVPLLTRYLSLATRTVLEHRGTVDKFIGDAVMAFWGAPLPDGEHALNACRTALALQRAMDRIAAELPDAAQGLQVRIGINTGPVLVGNIGSDDRLSYTVIGDPVNVASRLESLNKRYGTRIIVGEATRRACGDAIIVRELDAVAVYGRMQGTVIYELLGLAEDRPSLEPLDRITAYERALAAYRRRAWAEAVGQLQSNPGTLSDPPSALLLERALAYAASPPPADWRGVTVLDGK